jgi:hypothetical protein
VVRLFGFSVPPFGPGRRATFLWGQGRLSSEEQRAIRQAYDAAISTFAEASAVLYRRAADGAAPTSEDLRAYAEAQARLEVARATYHQSLWNL